MLICRLEIFLHFKIFFHLFSKSSFTTPLFQPTNSSFLSKYFWCFKGQIFATILFQTAYSSFLSKGFLMFSKSNFTTPLFHQPTYSQAFWAKFLIYKKSNIDNFLAHFTCFLSKGFDFLKVKDWQQFFSPLLLPKFLSGTTEAAAGASRTEHHSAKFLNRGKVTMPLVQLSNNCGIVCWWKERFFLQVTNKLAYSWLRTAHAVPSPFPV